MMARFLVGWVFFVHLLGHGVFINTPKIENPKAGQVLQGVVVITGSTDLNGFQSAEISFRYGGETQNEADWFLIHSGYEPVDQGTLAVWDTTTIADGTYDLRVLVTLGDGRQAEHVVTDLRVRNYTPIETNTPEANLPASTQPMDEATPTLEPLIPTPTEFQANPLEITRDAIRGNIFFGIMIGTGLILLLGAYSLIKKRIR